MLNDCQWWIDQFKDDYLQRGSSIETWNGDYWKILKHLPPNQALTSELLHSLVLSTPVNTRTRRRACMAVGALARFADLEYNPSPYQGRYSPNDVDPRQIPTDETIVNSYRLLSNHAWRWVYGILATYGLRPHEAFRLDFDRLRSGDRILRVLKPTKTGSREVWAYHPEWFDAFNLAEVRIPPINLERSNTRVGESASHYFHDIGLGHHLYDLRHRWAIRTLEYGLDYKIAAKMMGHSYAVHEQIYHRWIDASVLQNAYDKSINRGDRPLPPP